ncbi:MAG TPA: RagB/SusD family nutrient uptake outer membrane protein, partial [Cytophagales bacterium]|nr:RagB/SusD family nutrient uptake outer membrane protein [Cytophagales bacterium]
FYTPNLKAQQSPLPLLLPIANSNPTDAFYDLIYADLRYAIAHLPNTAIGDRVSKPIAEAFLARIYLTTKKYAEARDLAKKVIETYHFTLETQYKALWDMKNQENKEIIWATNFEVNDVYEENKNLYGYGYEDQSVGRGRNNSHTLFIAKYESRIAADNLGFINKDSVNTHWPLVKDVRNGNSFNRFVPTPYLLRLFNDSIDARYDGSFQTVWYSNKSISSPAAPKKFLLGDTALYITKRPHTTQRYYTFDYNTLFDAQGKSKNTRNNYMCPSLRKHMDSTRFTDPILGPSQTGQGNIQSFRKEYIIRLAEMYLIGAEAEMYLGNQAAARQYINTLRKRAALSPAAEAAMEIKQDLTIDNLLEERARELAGEYLRWYDLKRTGKLVELVTLHNPDIGAHLSELHLIRPVPQPQLDYMKGGTLTQHVGY